MKPLRILTVLPIGFVTAGLPQRNGPPTPPHGLVAPIAPATYAASDLPVSPWSFGSLQSTGIPSDGLFPIPQCHGFVLEEASIDEMQAAMANHTLTAVQLAACYLQRIFQTQEYLNILLQLNPDWPTIAAQADAERAAGTVRGPLHGIPFLIKDNIATADQLETTAGSWALLGSRVPRDAHVVARARQAGAVLLGKATLSEWADMRSTNYSEGFSGRGGQARSPYNLTVNPGGSSTGSAVGVAANAVAFALGTETDGSVINPAERNAIVGIKPTVGLTSRAGVVPESLNQDTVGVFGKTVRDATYALDAIFGPDARDPATASQAGHTPVEGYASLLSTKDALRGAVFGLPWATFWTLADPEQRRVLSDIVRLIEAAGATVLNGTELPSAALLVSPTGWDWDYGRTRGFPNESEFTYIKVDFYNNLRAYLAELTHTEMRSLADIVAFNAANDGSEGGYPWPRGHPAFYSGQDNFLASLATGGVEDETYHQALAFCRFQSRANGIDAALQQHDGTRLAGLLVPADVAQAPQVAAQAGYPMLTVPAGVHSASGMPFGLGLMQTAWGEAELVRWGSAIEDLLRAAGDGKYGRSAPRWRGRLQRNVPVWNVYEGAP